MNIKLTQALLLIDKTHLVSLKLWPLVAGICRSGKELADSRLAELETSLSDVKHHMFCHKCKNVYRTGIHSYTTIKEKWKYRTINLCYDCGKSIKQCEWCYCISLDIVPSYRFDDRIYLRVKGQYCEDSRDCSIRKKTRVKMIMSKNEP